MSADHWGFYQLPPFFTLQPAAATRDRQRTLWSNAIMDHATYHASHSRSGVSAVLRVYRGDSDIFNNAAIQRRMTAEDARGILEGVVALHPNHAVVLADNGPGDYCILVAPTEGGLREVEQSLLSWILEMGQGTTTAMLAKKGAVMTFDELAEAKCLQYNQKPIKYLKRSSAAAVPVRDCGELTEEQAIRSFLEALNNRPVSVLQPFKITLFNMDGTNTQPYQGVKFGG